MNGKIAFGISAALLALAAPAALAQKPYVVGAPAPSGNVIRQGTEIMLETTQEISSKNNRVGERIELELKEAISLNGRVAVPAGTRAVGEITMLKKKGMWGKSGKIEFRPLYLKLGDRQVRLSAAGVRDKGKAGTAGVVGAIAFVPIAGFLVTGTSAVIPPRTAVAATLDEDIPVVFAR